MLKAKALLADGRPLLIFGLSAENIRRLQVEDEPIRFNLAELGLVGEVLILAGETEQAIASKILGAKGTVQ